MKCRYIIQQIIFLLCSSMAFVSAQETETYVFTYEMNDFTFTKDVLNRTMITSDKYSIVYSDDVSEPSMPYVRVDILVSPNSRYDSCVFSFSENIVQNGVKMAPNPQIVEFGKDIPPMKEVRYKKNFYPISTRRGFLLREGTMGGYRILSFLVCPFRYSATLNRIELYQKVALTIRTESLKSLKASLRDNGFAQSVSRLVTNVEKMKEYASAMPMNTKEWGPGYLIICPEALKKSFEPLSEWEREKGLNAKIETLENILRKYTGLSDVVKIKRCIQDFYDKEDTKYVLLVGSGANFPIAYFGKDKIPTDYFYACLDEAADVFFEWGSNSEGVLDIDMAKIDLYPDIVVSRAPVESVKEAEIFVNKVLRYEKNPPQNDWCDKILFTGVSLIHSDQEPTDSEINSRWYYENTIQRYMKSPQFYFGRKYNNSITKAKLQTKLEEGYHVMHMMTHGDIDRFGLSDSVSSNKKDTIQGLYLSSDARSMQCQVPSIFVALSCLTNAFDYSRSLGRNFLINPENGVTSCIGTTRSSYFWSASPNPQQYRGIFDMHRYLFESAFSDSIMGQMGLSVNNARVRSFSEHTYNLFGFNMLGDPAMRMYLTQPKRFALSVSKEGSNFIASTPNACTFAVRYKGSNGSVVKREYIENITNYIIPEGQINNCEITLTAPNYIPSTFTFIPRYIQNITYNGDQTVKGDVIVAGENVTTQKPTGKVIVNSGNVIFSAKKGIILDAGFKVNKGATFKAVIE